MRRGFIAGGITLIVLGIIIFGVSSWIQNIQSNNVQQCNGLSGQISQSLSSENAEICNRAGPLLAAANMGIVVGIALTISGPLLRKTEKTKTETTKTEQYDIPSTRPCKACGKSIEWYQNSVVGGPDIWHKGCYPKTVKS